jgi:hypothetical protein
VQFFEGLPYNYLISQVKQELDEVLGPVKPWTEIFEPLLLTFPEIKAVNPKIKPYCYGDSLHSRFRIKIGADIAALTFRVILSKTIDVEEWKAVFQKDECHREEASRREIDFIALNATRQEKNTCISSCGEFFASQLKAEGFETTLLSLGGHSSTPIETLEERILQDDASEEEIRKLVLLHAEYIQRFVITSENLTEAEYRWRIRKNPLKRLLFSIKKLSRKN